MERVEKLEQGQTLGYKPTVISHFGAYLPRRVREKVMMSVVSKIDENDLNVAFDKLSSHCD